MKTYNILFVYPTMFHPERGGVERVTDLLAKEFVKKKYNVFYLHSKYDSSLVEYNYPAKCFFFPDGQHDSEVNKNFLIDFLLSKKIDIIINQTGAFSDSRLFLSFNNNHKIKTISVIHSTPILNYENLQYELFILRNLKLVEYVKRIIRVLLFLVIKNKYKKSLRIHYKWLFNNSDKVCLLSERYTDCFKLIDLCPPEYKMVSIPNPKTFCYNNIEIYKKEKILLFVGRLTYGQKRPDRMLKIWSKLYKKFPNWKLIMLGDGIDRKRLEKMAAKMERVEFTGYVDPTPYYKRSSILCMTSNFEGWPMVLPEGMSWGCVPILYGSFEAAYDIVSNNIDGIILKPFNEISYINSLREIMSDDIRRTMMANNAAKNIKKFDIDNVANKWYLLFKELCS